MRIALFFILAILSVSCTNTEQAENHEYKYSGPLFQELNPLETGIMFKNTILENEIYNNYGYGNLYNGAGVACGDLDNDGLPELIFTSTVGESKLYHNKGNMQFADVSFSAGITFRGGYNSGISMFDFNADGLLDIYICRSGLFSKELRQNLLYINMGGMKFEEKATEFGLNDHSYSLQSYYLDYDKDGDLDLYLVNHRVDFENSNVAMTKNRFKDDVFDSDRLYRNNGNNSFTDVTKKAGLMNFAFGLSASIGDFNNDSWPDVYVANDFLEADYLYINNQDGTFSDKLNETFNHISMYSMGSDYADINNDGLDDLVVVDMTPADHVRSKKLMRPMSSADFWTLVDFGFQPQFMINVLQLNRGDGHFSEIGQLAGISKTDWSWATLWADLNADGNKDLFVTNGIKREITDNDALARVKKLAKERGGKLTIQEVFNTLPSSELPNAVFENQGNLHFVDRAQIWGFEKAINSNGATYGDLDDDGDLDIVINNIDKTALVYENKLNQKNYIKVRLKGPLSNPFGIGSRVKLVQEKGIQVSNIYTSRGFLSSVAPESYFGFNKENRPVSIEVEWHDGSISTLNSPKTGETLTIAYELAKSGENRRPGSSTLVTSMKMPGLNFKHKEKEYDDFAKEVLLPHKQSENGPFISKGDVNGDGTEDVFISGASGQSGALYVQNADGSFSAKPQLAFSKDRLSEDQGSLFFDVDSDSDLDLYVVSGSNEFKSDSKLLRDRLYLNDGAGNFTKSSFTGEVQSGMSVVADDIDGDGDLDLFVGGRIIPGKYPFSPKSILWLNEGGTLKNLTSELAPDLEQIGLITDAVFSDFDSDGDKDLIACGEWTSIQLFENVGGKFSKKTIPELDDKTGWWYSITEFDKEGDGDMDYIVGNLGINAKYKAKPSKPAHVYASDFDENGTIDIVLSKKQGDINYPVRGKECSSQQMPFIAEKYPTFSEFAESSLESIYTEEKLAKALHLQATEFHTSYLINEGNGKFRLEAMPIECQFSPINESIVVDINKDGNQDLLLVGNLYGAEVETVRYDAGMGVCLIGDGLGNYTSVPISVSGFYCPGDAKSMVQLQGVNSKLILVGKNNSKLEVFKLEDSNSL